MTEHEDLTAGTTAVRINLLSCGHVTWLALPQFGGINYCPFCNRAAHVEHYIDEQAVDAADGYNLDESLGRWLKDNADDAAAADRIASQRFQRFQRAQRIAAAWGYRIIRDGRHYCVGNAGCDGPYAALTGYGDLDMALSWILDGCDEEAKKLAWDYMAGGGNDDDWKPFAEAEEEAAR
jgi:hypothetical protein